MIMVFNLAITAISLNMSDKPGSSSVVVTAQLKPLENKHVTIKTFHSWPNRIFLDLK